MPTIVKTKKLNKPQRRKLQLERKVERRMAKLRNNPLQDKYGRPIAEESPIGAGDKNWIKNFNTFESNSDIGVISLGKYTLPKTPAF